MFNYAFNSKLSFDNRKLLKFGVVVAACNRGPYIKRVSLWSHSSSFDMKTVRKPGDFSIEGILADTFIFLHNDRCKNTLQSTVAQDCQVKFPKWDNCARYPKPIFQAGIGNGFKSVKNNFEFAKRNLTMNGKANFEIATKDMSVVRDLDKNYKSYIAKNVGEEDEVRTERKNLQEPSLEKYNEKGANLQGNINHRHDISNSNGKRNIDTLMTYRRIREGRNKTEYKNCTKLFLGNQCNLNDNIAPGVIKYIKAEIAINDSKSKSEVVSVNYENINEPCDIIDTNKRRAHLNNVQEGNKSYSSIEQRGKLKQNQRAQFCNKQIKNTSVSCNQTLEDKNENLRHNLGKKFQETETNLLLIDNQNKDLVKLRKEKTGSHQMMQNTTTLEWLNYTRYKPPKVSRKPMVGNNKRKRSTHPRIPFTTFQLEFLEQKFRKSAYLSKDDVSKISDVLRLPSNRVKIWFQNRRARERRKIE